MSNIEFKNYLNRHECKISVDDLFNGTYDKLLARGLRVLTLCNDGTGRSSNLATRLTNYGIPSVRLDGGLKQFKEDEELINSYIYAQSMINVSPNVAVILLPDERKYFYKNISGIRAAFDQDVPSAFDSICKMES